MNHPVVWVEIPVEDLDRAIRFYSAVLGDALTKQSFNGVSFGMLPHEAASVGWCLVRIEDHKPSRQGPLIYLSAAGRLDEAEAAVEPHGGKVLTPKHAIGPHGFRSIVLDSEGNRIGLHSM